MTNDIKLCCKRPMLYTAEIMDMNIDSVRVWICPVCLSYEKNEKGNLDMEDACNWLGIDSQNIPDSATDEEYADIITKLYNEVNEYGNN